MEINKELIALINNQINLEELSSRVYLNLSIWCGANGYTSAQAYYLNRSNEEIKHRDMQIQFLLDCGYAPILKSIDNPSLSVKNLENSVTESLAHEKLVTSKIFEIMKEADRYSDCNVKEFFLFFVKEQREEEKTYIDLYDYAEKIGLFSDAPEWAKGMMRAELEEKISGD